MVRKNCLKVISFLSPLFLFVLLVSPVHAAAPDGAGPWADTVAASSQGTTKAGLPIGPLRSDPTSTLGVAEDDTVEGHFFSLGFGGTITLGFDNGISSGVMVVEATNPGYPAEKAKVEVSPDGTTWTDAGTITQDGQVNKPETVGCVKFVRLTDVSNIDDFSDSTADAYDVDGVKALGDPCTPPPPTGGCSCDCNIKQSNVTNTSVVVSSKSNTGNNKASKNTGGNNTITTGDASSSVNVSVGGSTNTATCVPCPKPAGGTNVIISGNGAGSKNTVTITSIKKKF